MKIREKNWVIKLPSIKIVQKTSFQNRLAMALNNLPVPKSRRRLMVEVPVTIIAFKGKILLPIPHKNGSVIYIPYPRRDVDNVMGHESGRQISMFKTLINGELRYKPRPETYPRLLALYCYIAIKWPHIAEHIVK